MRLSVTFVNMAVNKAGATRPSLGNPPGYSPLMLLAMMRRFARVNPQELKLLAARDLNPTAIKSAWIETAIIA